VAYFYCANNTSEPGRADLNEILQSMVRQLAFAGRSPSGASEALLADHRRRESETKIVSFERTRPGIKECIKYIFNMTNLRLATIIIDALDEVHFERRHNLTNALQRITKESASVLKLFITSRDSYSIWKEISISPQDNRTDMEAFVHHQVTLATRRSRLLNGHVSDDL
ncbi:hypothetical protein AOQ84DRAFT_306776, partial [Glonium stellatum]